MVGKMYLPSLIPLVFLVVICVISVAVFAMVLDKPWVVSAILGCLSVIVLVVGFAFFQKIAVGFTRKQDDGGNETSFQVDFGRSHETSSSLSVSTHENEGVQNANKEEPELKIDHGEKRETEGDSSSGIRIERVPVWWDVFNPQCTIECHTVPFTRDDIALGSGETKLIALKPEIDYMIHLKMVDSLVPKEYTWIDWGAHFQCRVRTGQVKEYKYYPPINPWIPPSLREVS